MTIFARIARQAGLFGRGVIAANRTLQYTGKGVNFTNLRNDIAFSAVTSGIQAATGNDARTEPSIGGAIVDVGVLAGKAVLQRVHNQMPGFTPKEQQANLQTRIGIARQQADAIARAEIFGIESSTVNALRAMDHISPAEVASLNRLRVSEIDPGTTDDPLS